MTKSQLQSLVDLAREKPSAASSVSLVEETKSHSDEVRWIVGLLINATDAHEQPKRNAFANRLKELI